jgi:hypothetical protein
MNARYRMQSVLVLVLLEMIPSKALSLSFVPMSLTYVCLVFIIFSVQLEQVVSSQESTTFEYVAVGLVSLIRDRYIIQVQRKLSMSKLWFISTGGSIKVNLNPTTLQRSTMTYSELRFLFNPSLCTGLGNFDCVGFSEISPTLQRCLTDLLWKLSLPNPTMGP